jgi:hypothetical protein
MSASTTMPRKFHSQRNYTPKNSPIRYKVLTADYLCNTLLGKESDMELLTALMDNVVAYRLGRVGLQLMEYPKEKIGDEIDRGLVLRRLLEEAGFGVVVLPKVQDDKNQLELFSNES